MQSELARAAGLAAAALFGSAAAAPAQYASAPFLDSTVELSQALGLELIAARLMLADRYPPPLDHELVEQFEDMTGRHWARFGGSLAVADAELAERLHDALKAATSAAEAGEKTTAAAAEAAALLEDARAVLFEEELRQSPEFQGALLVDLLLIEGGVAEGYEEAAEDLWEYPTGWAGLQRVDVIWSDIANLASEDRRRDAEEMLAALHELFPDPGPPDAVVGWNPEEAEAPAQRLAGIVEEVVDADLFPGRDMAALAGHLATTTEKGCAAFAAGEDARAVEHVRAVFELYDGHLADTAQLFAIEPHEDAERLFSQIVGIEEDEEEGKDAGRDEDNDGQQAGSEGGADEDGDDDAEKSEAATLPPADSCANLSAALQNVRNAMGG